MAANLPRIREILPRLGYELRAYGGLYAVEAFYWGIVPQPGIHCPECYSPLDQEFVSRDVRARMRKDAMIADGHIIVSERFRDFCVQNRYEDLVLHEVGKKRKRYELRAKRVLRVDLYRSQPYLGEFCTRCGNFECYLRGKGLFLENVDEPLPDGFYRTDLIWGCRAGKHPLVLVGAETKRKLLAAGLTGLDFRSVPFVDEGFEAQKALNDASLGRTSVKTTE